MLLMGMEGGGRWERPRLDFEKTGILRHPEQVFDSPRREAQQSSRQVMEHLRERTEVSYVGDDVECRIERDGR